jgi:hypothetical protein
MKRCSTTALALVFILALPAAALVHAEGAWVSVPSTPDASERVLIRGGGLAPLATVTVTVQDASGAKSEQQGLAGEDGTFTTEYLPPVPGSYQVQVTDQQGNLIGRGSFGYLK